VVAEGVVLGDMDRPQIDRLPMKDFLNGKHLPSSTVVLVVIWFREFPRVVASLSCRATFVPALKDSMQKVRS